MRVLSLIALSFVGFGLALSVSGQGMGGRSASGQRAGGLGRGEVGGRPGEAVEAQRGDGRAECPRGATRGRLRVASRSPSATCPTTSFSAHDRS